MCECRLSHRLAKTNNPDLAGHTGKLRGLELKVPAQPDNRHGAELPDLQAGQNTHLTCRYQTLQV